MGCLNMSSAAQLCIIYIHGHVYVMCVCVCRASSSMAMVCQTIASRSCLIVGSV